jgi:hypothetical protein
VSRPTPIPRPDLAQLVARARPIRGLAVIGAIVMLALATACGASASEHTSLPVDTAVAPSSTSPDPTSPTTDHEAIKLAARDAYVEFWNVWTEANNPPDPSYRRLSDFYTGVQLEGARMGIERNRSQGLLVVDDIDRPENHSIVFMQVEPAKVVFDDCSVDNGRTVSATTGRTVDDKVMTYLRRVQMTFEDDRWKVESAKEVNTWPGATDC